MVDRAESKESGGFGETVKVIFQALLLALVIRTVLFQPFSIPSGSMMPTLVEGDYIFVSKWSYGFSRYSLPSLPPYIGYLPVEGRALESAPTRGDIVVFRKPHEEETDYIKRLIGLPGDRIQVREGTLLINGVAVPREPAEDYVAEDGSRVPQFRETLPNGVSYLTLDLNPNSTGDNTRERPYAAIYPRVTTRSNTFRVHFIAQSITKSRSAGFDTVEPNVKIESEYRGSAMIERYLDPREEGLPDFTTTGSADSLDAHHHFRITETRKFGS